MMKLRAFFLCTALAAPLRAGGSAAFPRSKAREQKETAQTATAEIHTGRAECAVDLDDSAQGKTDTGGNFTIRGIEPLDHYIHVSCPDAAQRAFYILPAAGQAVEIHAEPANQAAASAAPTPLEAAESKIRLRRLIKQAIDLRSQGRFDEAVVLLHESATLDPENSDLHRELGITFLLDREWPRARIEMLEAIRHKPDDADAHNGLGYALEKMGDLAGALKEYRKATQLDPDDEEYRKHYLDMLVKVTAPQTETTKEH